MRILGNYFVFLISMMGLKLAHNNDQQQISAELLELHNDYRQKHKAEKLVLDEELSQTAMRLAMNHGIDPEGKVDVGTNVFFEQHISKLNARDVFFSWYNTGVKYKHKDDQEMLLETDSFTQIVWKSTKQMGVAVFEGKYYVTLIVTYSPRGNIPGQYMANVTVIEDRKDDSSSSQGPKRQKTSYEHLSYE